MQVSRVSLKRGIHADGTRREFEPTFKSAAKAWQKTASEHRNSHFFASIDFETGQDVFREVSHALTASVRADTYATHFPSSACRLHPSSSPSSLRKVPVLQRVLALIQFNTTSTASTFLFASYFLYTAANLSRIEWFRCCRTC